MCIPILHRGSLGRGRWYIISELYVILVQFDGTEVGMYVNVFAVALPFDLNHAKLIFECKVSLKF